MQQNLQEHEGYAQKGWHRIGHPEQGQTGAMAGDVCGKETEEEPRCAPTEWRGTQDRPNHNETPGPRVHRQTCQDDTNAWKECKRKQEQAREQHRKADEDEQHSTTEQAGGNWWPIY